MPKARSRSATTTSLSKFAGDRPGDVVRDHRRADAALAADEGDRAAERVGAAVDIEIGRSLRISASVDRRDQIFADAAADEFAIEVDVVDMADDDDLGAGVADFGEAVELGIELVARQLRFDDDQIGRGGSLVEFAGRGEAAGMDLDMGAGHAPVRGGLLDDGGEVRRFAESLDRDPRAPAARSAGV